jgi:hypothetical protein
MRNLLPQLLNRCIERIRNGVRINLLVRQQILVEPLSHVGAIGVAHRPVGLMLGTASSLFRAYSPHRRHYTLEARVQHRRSKVDDLVRLLLVSLGCLARRQIREPRLVEVERHQLGHRKLAVAEMEAALECVIEVLGSVASEVHKVRRLDPIRHPLYRSSARYGLDFVVWPC